MLGMRSHAKPCAWFIVMQLGVEYMGAMPSLESGLNNGYWYSLHSHTTVIAATQPVWPWVPPRRPCLIAAGSRWMRPKP